MKEEKREELQKRAQELLDKARECIDKAGELAEKGDFTLWFGEIGGYYPESMWDREKFRERALEEAKTEGRQKYNYGTGKYDVTPWTELSEEEQSDLVEETMDSLMEAEFDHAGGHDAREYGSPGWWHPSRC